MLTPSRRLIGNKGNVQGRSRYATETWVPLNCMVTVGDVLKVDKHAYITNLI